MLLETFHRGPDRNLTYLFGPEGASGPLAAVDPGPDVAPLLAAARGRPIETIFVTHGHGDHIEGLAPLRARTGARIAGHPGVARDLERVGVALDLALDDGARLDVGSLPVEVLHTPGHHPAAICMLAARRWLFTGDTLFVGNCGRADLAGSDPRALYASLARLRGLDEAIVILPGHHYGSTPQSTIGREKRENPPLRAGTFEEFDALP